MVFGLQFSFQLYCQFPYLSKEKKNVSRRKQWCKRKHDFDVMSEVRTAPRWKCAIIFPVKIMDDCDWWNLCIIPFYNIINKSSTNTHTHTHTRSWSAHTGNNIKWKALVTLQIFKLIKIQTAFILFGNRPFLSMLSCRSLFYRFFLTIIIVNDERDGQIGKINFVALKKGIFAFFMKQSKDHGFLKKKKTTTKRFLLFMWKQFQPIIVSEQ